MWLSPNCFVRRSWVIIFSVSVSISSFQLTKGYFVILLLTKNNHQFSITLNIYYGLATNSKDLGFGYVIHTPFIPN